MAFDDGKGRRLTSFNAITGSSAGNSTSAGTNAGKNLGAGYSKISMQVVTAASSFAVYLQGSIAGGSSSWTTMGIIATSSAGASGNIVTSTEQGQTGLCVTRVRTQIVTIPTTANAAGTLDAVIAVSQ